MWCVERRFRARLLPVAVLAASLISAGCTVEPLANARTDSALATASIGASVSETLASTEVSPVDDRVAQQVRNRLLFAMNGGTLREGGLYRVDLSVTSITRLLSVRSNVLAPTSAQVRVQADYAIRTKADGKVIATGQRNSLAAYDRTPQSFANLRAKRDAENRAARDVAEKLQLAIAQKLAAL